LGIRGDIKKSCKKGIAHTGKVETAPSGESEGGGFERERKFLMKRVPPEGGVVKRGTPPGSKKKKNRTPVMWSSSRKGWGKKWGEMCKGL